MSVTVGKLWAMCGSAAVIDRSPRDAVTCATTTRACGWPPDPAVAIVPVHGHAKVTTTLTVYTHLFADDHTDAMAALGAMGQAKPEGNVVALRR
jgi:hypothetical protein